jgi:hypothetical protein
MERSDNAEIWQETWRCGAVRAIAEAEASGHDESALETWASFCNVKTLYNQVASGCCKSDIERCILFRCHRGLPWGGWSSADALGRPHGVRCDDFKVRSWLFGRDCAFKMR